MAVALGAYFLAHGELAHVRVICELLAGVPPATLERVAAELMAVDDPVFWELTDRVVNFDYVEPDVRARLPELLERIPLVAISVGDQPVRPGAAAPTSS
jgi:hypothetical protein